MVICLIYIGIIVLLHIFGKVKSAKTIPNFPTPEPDFDDTMNMGSDGGSGEDPNQGSGEL